MKPRVIFKNLSYDKEFKERGFVIIDLFDKQTVNNILQEVRQLITDAGVDAPFYTSLWSNNAEYRKKTDELIHKTIGKNVSEYFYKYKAFFGDLLVKRPSFTKNFPIHQDWTFVDEEIFTSVYVWVPLQDVNYLNGNLQIVEGSHLFLDKIRGANVRVSYEDIKPLIAKKYLKDIKLKAGQAIIFNQALLHASPPNRSLKTRIAMGLLMLPEEADIYHYFFDNETKEIKRTKTNKDFYMHYSDNFDFKNALINSSFSFTHLKNIESVKVDIPKTSWEIFVTKTLQYR